MKRFGLSIWAFALLLGFLVLEVTRMGIGLFGDCAAYFYAARSLLEGRGFENLAGGLLSNYSPLFPLFLAGLGIFGLEPAIASRCLNLFLYVVLLASIGFTVRRCAQSSLLCYAAMAVAATSAPFLACFSAALSEPLFLFLLFWSLIFLTNYMQQGRLQDLLIMSVCIALAFLTRYVGVSLVILGGIVILVSSRGQPVLRRRATDFVVFCLITIVPMLIWLLRGEGHAVGASRLSMLSWHPIPFEKLQEISRTVMYWFLPLRIPLGCAVWLVPLLFVLFGITFFRELTSRFPGSIKGAKWGWRASFVLVSLLFLALYGILLVLAYTFYAASTPWDNRILSPMYLVGLVSALIACASYLDVPNPQRVFISFFMVCVLLGILAINIRRHADWIQTGALEGIGYAHRSWQESRAVAYLLNLPKDVLIVTNNVEAVYLLTGRRAVPLPNKVDPSTLRAVRTRSLSELLERLRGPTVLVFWHKTEVSGYDFSPQELQERMSLSLLRLAEYQDATVYQIEPKQGGIKGAPPYPPRRSREG